jgi:putative ABC transport system permease protein
MIKLALRNIARQKAHTAMTLAAVVMGVAGLILVGGWVADIFVQLAEALIHSQSGHVQVYTKGYYAGGSRSPEKYLIGEPDGVKRRIARTNGVDAVMARLNFSGLLSTGRSDVPVVVEGVEPGKEAALGTFVTIAGGRNLADTDAFGVVVGRGVAEALKIKPGDHVTLLANTLEGALNTVDLEVIGVFQTFSNDYDARALKIPLVAAQDLLGKAAANAIVVSLKKTADTERIAALLESELGGERMEVKRWTELNDFYDKAVALYSRQFGVLQFIALVMVILSVANSVNMSVFERTGEFGTMMALGNRRRKVSQLIVVESLLLGLIGSALGVAVGVLLALAISAIGIPMPPPPNANVGYRAAVQIIPEVLLTSLCIGVAATVVAALFPAARVSRTPVVDALRANV